MLKYTNYGICFQEVPNEVALYFNISNCQIHCPDCHSKFLWEDCGEPLIKNLIPVLDKYKDYITCVCFMGGVQEIKQLKSAIDIVKANSLKVCVYTGETYEGNEDKYNLILKDINYIKFGPYIDEYGGLDKKTTNQRFYLVVNGQMINQTELFQGEKIRK